MTTAGKGAAAHSALFTDFYQLTMARAYAAESMDRLAVFELFFRTMPQHRNFILTAGLAAVADFLEDWQFTPDDLEYLDGLGGFPTEFLEELGSLRFTGDVYAMPEGTVVFPGEPILQVVAPMMQAQLVETFLLNQVHFQSLAASKAARVVLAAKGRAVVDFGSRRAHGTDAALKVARSACIAGAAGTSNVQAGSLYGLPVYGTMAHSYIQACGDEGRAFEAFARLYPETTLLVDTYDTLEGVAEVIRLAGRLGRDFHVRAIRLDSGDLVALSRECRLMLDGAGLQQVNIFASGDLDEYAIAALVAQGAPIDAFGVGTRMAVSADAPDMDVVYKLVEYDGQPRTKLSTNKVLYPGRKQVRRFVQDGRFTGDIVCGADEAAGGEPLLRQVMRQGKALPQARESLEICRARAAVGLAALPQDLSGLDGASPYPVAVSPALQKELADLRAVYAAARTSASVALP